MRNKNVQWKYSIETTIITAVNVKVLNESKARGQGHDVLLFNIFIFILNVYPHANVLTKGTLAFIFTEGKYLSKELCLTELVCLQV